MDLPAATPLTERIKSHVQDALGNEATGHDWWHIVRVKTMAKKIALIEGADPLVVELAALLHDIADWKAHNGDESIGPRRARELLELEDADPTTIEHVCEIIATLSFKGATVMTPMRTLEGKIVQDADRLDAIGAIGVARAFTYGGHHERPIHDPSARPSLHATKEEYFNNRGSTINHFYEKLLLLKDRMNTKTARNLAEKRHRFLEYYLEQFFAECNGKS